MSDETAPHRRHVLKLDLQADSLPDLVDELHAIADGLELRDEEKVTRTSGGVHTGYHLELTTDYEQTHSRYQAAIKDYLAAVRRAKKAEQN